MNQSIRVAPKQFIVILPDGAKHELPKPYFWYYAVMGLIRISQKHENVAHVPRQLRAYPHRGGSALRFELRQKTPIDRFAVPSNFRSLLQLSKVIDGNLYDDMLEFYSVLERHFENQAA